MAEPLATLIAAVITKWNAEASLTGLITGGIWFGERPADAQENPEDGDFFPYAIFPSRENRARLFGYTCGTELSEIDILVRVYGKTPELCAAYAAAVKAIYDSDALSLSLAEGSVVRHRPGGDVRYPQADKNVYYVDLPYEFLTQRNRPA